MEELEPKIAATIPFPTVDMNSGPRVYALADGVALFYAPGDPEGKVVANQGSLCTTPGGLYWKSSNGVATGWQLFL